LEPEGQGGEGDELGPLLLAILSYKRRLFAAFIMYSLEDGRKRESSKIQILHEKYRYKNLCKCLYILLFSVDGGCSPKGA